jgi:hypothetical protein
MCFIGHGAFGILTKAAWVPYFAVAGVGETAAWRLMPLIGGVDIAIGVLVFVWPCRALFAWAATWAMWTAALRPFAGQGWSEFFERAGNSSLAALSGDTFLGGYPQDKHAGVSAKVKALAGVYGVYDLKEMWHRYGMQSPRENNIENFLGAPPMENPRLYFDASSINYATVANNQIGVFLSVGTEDDLVDRTAQTDAFLLALKQAGFFVRTCIVQGAPHYWLGDPIEEPDSYPGFVAPRLVRFLQERL